MKTNGYSIYMHKSPSGKVYIGQTLLSMNQRWGKNGSAYLRKKNGKDMHPLFANAIRKYGWDSFEHKILFENLSSLEADMIEEDLVYYYRKQGLSYNAISGGNGTKSYKPSNATKKKHSASMKAYWDSDENVEGKARTIEALTEYGKNYRFTSESHPDKSRAVIQYSLDGEFLAEYPSATEAGRILNRRREGIKDCCTGRQKTAYGYKWRYKDE